MIAPLLVNLPETSSGVDTDLVCFTPSATLMETGPK